MDSSSISYIEASLPDYMIPDESDSSFSSQFIHDFLVEGEQLLPTEKSTFVDNKFHLDNTNPLPTAEFQSSMLCQQQPQQLNNPIDPTLSDLLESLTAASCQNIILDTFDVNCNQGDEEQQRLFQNQQLDELSSNMFQPDTKLNSGLKHINKSFALSTSSTQSNLSSPQSDPVESTFSQLTQSEHNPDQFSITSLDSSIPITINSNSRTDQINFEQIDLLGQNSIPLSSLFQSNQHADNSNHCLNLIDSMKDNSNQVTELSNKSTNQLSFNCPKCDKSFSKKKAFSVHLYNVHPKQLCHCEVGWCGKKFKRRRDLFCHYRNVHKGVNFPCDQCKILQNEKDLMVDHLRTYHQIELSGLTKNLNPGFEKQQPTHQPNPPTHLPIPLSDCIMLTPSNTLPSHQEKKLQEHQIPSRLSPDKHFRDRAESVSDSNELLGEMASNGIDTLPGQPDTEIKQESPNQSSSSFNCLKCGKYFKNKDTFDSHRRQVHPKTMLHCEVSWCGKRFKRNTSLFQHYRTIHKGIDFPCDQCKILRKRKDLMLNHLRTYHQLDFDPPKSELLDKPFKCHKCTKSFGNKNSLNSHISYFHSKHLYSCKANGSCDKKFKTLSMLIRHYRAVHKKAIFPCDQCTKLRLKRDLIVHHLKTYHQIDFDVEQQKPQQPEDQIIKRNTSINDLSLKTDQKPLVEKELSKDLHPKQLENQYQICPNNQIYCLDSTNPKSTQSTVNQLNCILVQSNVHLNQPNSPTHLLTLISDRNQSNPLPSQPAPSNFDQFSANLNQSSPNTNHILFQMNQNPINSNFCMNPAEFSNSIHDISDLITFHPNVYLNQHFEKQQLTHQPNPPTHQSDCLMLQFNPLPNQSGSLNFDQFSDNFDQSSNSMVYSNLNPDQSNSISTHFETILNVQSNSKHQKFKQLDDEQIVVEIPEDEHLNDKFDAKCYDHLAEIDIENSNDSDNFDYRDFDKIEVSNDLHRQPQQQSHISKQIPTLEDILTRDVTEKILNEHSTSEQHPQHEHFDDRFKKNNEQSCMLDDNNIVLNPQDNFKLQSADNATPTKCPFAECGDLTFNHPLSLLRHTRLKHPESLHSIHLKPVRNVRRAQKSNHVLKCFSEAKRFNCLQCDKSYTRQVDLEKHVELIHTITRKRWIECQIDQQVKRQRLEQIIDLNEPDPMSNSKTEHPNFTLNYCRIPQISIAPKQDQELPHSPNPSSFNCPECGIIFSTQGFLNSHIQKCSRQIVPM